MRHVLNSVVARFVTVYGEPKSDNAEALYSEYIRALKGFSQEILEAAVDEVIKGHTFPTWPVPGEVYKAASAEGSRRLRVYGNGISDSSSDEHSPPIDYVPPTPEEREANQRAIEQMRRMYCTAGDGPALPIPTRELMERLQAAAVKTEDGRRRHLKNYVPGMTGEHSE